MNITEGLRRIARETPDAPAVIAGTAIDGVPEGRVYTCAQLDRVIDAIALRAAGWNLPPGKHAALLTKSHLPMLLLRLGLARAGVPTCNIPAPAHEGIRIVLHDAGDRDDVRTIVADASWWTEESDVPAPMITDGDTLLAHQGTSGTLGAPKLVPWTHAIFAGRYGRLFAWMPPPRDTRTMCTIGPGGGPALGYMINTIEANGASVVAELPGGFLSSIERHRVNLLVTNPFGATGIVESLPAGAPRPPSLEQVVLTGARVTAGMARLVTERLCPNVLSSYASTEAGLIAAGPVSEAASIEGAAGYAYDGVAIEILDDNGAVLPKGATGHVRVRTPGQAREYLGDPEATARTFRDGWVYMQDIGRITGDGTVVIAGRSDDVITLGGSKVSPDAIESVLLGVPGIREAAVFGVPDEYGKHVVHAAIVTDGDIQLSALQTAFGRQPGVPPPSVTLRIRRLPRNAAGKVVRADLVRFVQAMRAKGRP